MAKIIVIEDCIRCPNLFGATDEDFCTRWTCTRTGKVFGPTVDSVPIIIPEWCPLDSLDD